MIRSRVAAIMMPILALSLASCGDRGEGLAPVTGKVVVNGQPAAGAVLSFHRRAGEAPPPQAAKDLIPSAVVQDNGSFTVETYPLGYGAAPGKYAILVQWPEEKDPAQSQRGGKPKVATIQGKKVVMTKHDKHEPLAPDRLKGRYSDATKPLLQAEITVGTNDVGSLELDLKN